MSQIAILAPNSGIATCAQRVKEKYRLDIDIYVGLMDEGIKTIKELSGENEPKIVISRGGTAILLRESGNYNVVEIKMALEDAIQAIIEARKYGSNILFLSFLNHTQGIDNLGKITGLKIKQTILNSWHEVKPTLVKAVEEGIDVVVGGAIQNKISQQMGIPSVFLESGEDSIYNAYLEAKALLDVLVVQERKLQETYTVLNYSSDGFVAIDINGNVTLMNFFAEKLFKKKTSEIVGLPVVEALPKLSEMIKSLESTKQEDADILKVNNTTVLFQRISMVHKGKIVGAMATLKDIHSVYKDEQRIRYQQYTSGLYAKYYFSDIIGQSKEILKAKEAAKRFAETESTILITSESGTGKELFAQSIHNASSRSEGPFVAINCASFSEGILESELFGYVDGAFTGAKKSGKVGVFELAKGGTIFLDEIGEISPSVQGKLLRVLQERCIMRLGDTKIVPVDVKVIAATNRDLVKGVQLGYFRQDLFFRLNVLHLTIPSLRERKGDIKLLAEYFAKQFSNTEVHVFSKWELDLLESYNWPGNVRELENLIERIMILKSSIPVSDIICQHFDEMRYLSEASENPVANEPITYEKARQTVEICGGSKTLAAKKLGIHRSTLYRILGKQNKC